MKRFLPLLLLMLPLTGYAQQLHIYCNHLLTVPCTTNSPLTPTNLWDPPWLMGGKAESNFNLLFSPAGLGSIINVTGPLYGNGLNAPSAATAAQLGSVFNVTGLMLGTGLGAPTAYGGSACGANTFATSSNASGVLTCTTAAQLNVAQTWSAVQTIPAADLAITSPATAAGNDFACWNSTTHVLSVETTPACNGFSPAALNVVQSWSAAQTFPAADFLITGLSTAAGTGFVCDSTGTNQLSVESTPTCNGFSPAALNVAQTWSAAQTFPAADFLITSLSTAAGTGFVCDSTSTNQLSVESTPTCNGFQPAALNVANTWTATQTFATANATTLQQGGTPIQQLPTLFDTISATTYSLVATDCGRTKYFTSGSATTITVPSSTLAVGCIVVLIINGAASTITGSGLTLQLLGTTTTGNRAAVNGAGVTLTFATTTLAFVGGPGVT